MKRIILFGHISVIIFFLFFSASLIAQEIESPTYRWVQTIGGLDDDYGSRAAVAEDGTCYFAGSFRSEMTISNSTLVSAGVDDIYLIKTTEQGDVLWAKRFGGPQGDGISAIEIDNTGAVYLAGNFNEEISFGDITLFGRGENDIFLAKLNTDGEVLWVKKSGGSQSDLCTGLALGNDGSIWMTGYFEGTARFDAISLNSVGSYDVFVAKHDNSGNVSFAHTAGGVRGDLSADISVGPDGNYVIAGRFRSESHFGNVTLNSSSNDLFIAKYSADGTIQWAHGAGGPYQDGAVDVCIDHNRYIFLTGYFDTEAEFGATTLTGTGDSDIFVAKYDPTGILLWIRQAGGEVLNIGSDIIPDGRGGCVVGGFYSWDGVFGSQQLSSFGREDGFIARYDASGNVSWAMGEGGISEDRIVGVAEIGDGGYVLTGWYEDINYFGPLVIASNGNRDGFIARIDAPLPAVTPIAQDRLLYNWPNPFNDMTTITFQIDEPGHVALEILNIQGQEIVTLVNQEMPAGTHQITWHGIHLDSGLYIYRIKAGSFIASKKCLLVR